MSRPIRLFCALAVAATALAFAQSAQAQVAYGISSSGLLFRFDISSPGPVTIIRNLGITPEAADFRPGTRTLYALDVEPEVTQLYAIDALTGSLTAVGDGFPTTVEGEPAGNYSLAGATIGLDFNPRTLQADGSVRIRVVASNGTNLRLNSDTGLVANVDAPLAYAAGDPNADATPSVDAAAYTNSVDSTVPAAGTTTLYVLDFGTDSLATQNPPNNGTLNTVGPLGASLDVLPGIGFDIVSDPNSADDSIAGDTGYAVLRRADVAGGAYLVYNVDLATGQLTGGALVGNGEADFAGGFAVLPQDAAAGQVLISEFRFRGPEPSASPTSSQNEFIELYNNTDSDILVTATDGSAGWAVATPSAVTKSPRPRGAGGGGLTLFVIPNGTILPARGHYLATQSLGFSLQDYSNGSGSGVGAGDIQYSFDVPDAEGIALFATANGSNFNPATRLDAVGIAAGAPPPPAAPRVSDPLYAEGTPIPSAVTVANEHSFVRRLETGRPLDTDNNANDFVLVSTDPAALGGGSQAVLGAPGPQGTLSPVQGNAIIKASLIDGGCYETTDPARACGRTRYAGDTAGPNRTFGTMRIRRRWTNTDPERFVTRLRFRVVDVTTNGSPIGCANCTQADLRALSAADETGLVVSGGGTADSFGVTLEEPPAQPLGGGLNSTLAAGTVSPGTPLAPGDSINLTFLIGVEQAGLFRFYVNVEAVTVPPEQAEGPSRLRPKSHAKTRRDVRKN